MPWLLAALAALWVAKRQRGQTPAQASAADGTAQMAPTVDAETPSAWPTEASGPLAPVAVDTMPSFKIPGAAPSPVSRLTASQVSPSSPMIAPTPFRFSVFPGLAPKVDATTSPSIFVAIRRKMTTPVLRGY